MVILETLAEQQSNAQDSRRPLDVFKNAEHESDCINHSRFSAATPNIMITKEVSHEKKHPTFH